MYRAVHGSAACEAVSMDPCRVRRRRRAFSSCPGKRGHFAVRIALVITKTSIHELLPHLQGPSGTCSGTPVLRQTCALPWQPDFTTGDFPLFTSKASWAASHPDFATYKLSLFSSQKLHGARPTPISQPASFLSFHLESFPGRVSPRFRNLQAFSLFISKASWGASHPDFATCKLSLFSRHLRQKLNRPKGPVQKLSIFCQMFCEMF